MGDPYALIGGGPRAFQTYEAGELLPSRAIGSALARLEHDPAGFSALHRRAHAGRPEPAPCGHHAGD